MDGFIINLDLILMTVQLTLVMISGLILRLISKRYIAGGDNTYNSLSSHIVIKIAKLKGLIYFVLTSLMIIYLLLGLNRSAIVLILFYFILVEFNDKYELEKEMRDK